MIMETRLKYFTIEGMLVRKRLYLLQIISARRKPTVLVGILNTCKDFFSELNASFILLFYERGIGDEQVDYDQGGHTLHLVSEAFEFYI